MFRSKVFWQAMVVAVTVSGPLIFWFFWQKENKNISLSVDSNVSIVSLGKDKIDGVDLYYKGNKIESLSVIDIIIQNDGNTPIKKEDFSKPLQIKFAGNIVPDPVVVDVGPKQLEPRFSVLSDNIFELEPLLLNPGDMIRLRFNLSNLQASDLDIQGRVVGVKQLSASVKNNGHVIDYKFVALIESSLLFAALIYLIVDIIAGVVSGNKRKKAFVEALSKEDYDKAICYSSSTGDFDKVFQQMYSSKNKS